VLAIQSSDDFLSAPDAFRLTIEPLLGEPDLAISAGCDVYLQPDGVNFSCSQLGLDHDITPRSLLMRGSSRSIARSSAGRCSIASARCGR
jgi:hypothetical protein